MMPTPTTCEEHGAARNVIWSAPERLEQWIEDRADEQPLRDVDRCGQPRRGDRAGGERTAAGGIPRGDQHVQRLSTGLVPPAADDPIDEVRCPERETQLACHRVKNPAKWDFGRATLSGWASRRQSSSIGPGASQRAESVRQLAERRVAVRLRLFRQAPDR